MTHLLILIPSCRGSMTCSPQSTESTFRLWHKTNDGVKMVAKKRIYWHTNNHRPLSIKTYLSNDKKTLVAMVVVVVPSGTNCVHMKRPIPMPLSLVSFVVSNRTVLKHCLCTILITTGQHTANAIKPALKKTTPALKQFTHCNSSSSAPYRNTRRKPFERDILSIPKMTMLLSFLALSRSAHQPVGVSHSSTFHHTTKTLK